MFTKKDLVRLIIPLIIEQLLAVTIGLADTLMVSSVGEAAVSGVSTVDTINILLINIFSALATGGAIVASQYLGREDDSSACIVAKQLVYTVFAIAVAVAAVCVLAGGPLLVLIFGAVEPAVMNNCKIYFFWSALSYPFIAVYNGGAALFRAMGNSKISMFTSLLMNIINVCGNALLIYGFALGVAGAAIASLVSRLIGAILIITLLRNPHCRIRIESLTSWEFHPGMVSRILRVGVPNGMENGMFQIGKILVQGLVASFGTTAIAANAVANSIATFTNIPGVAIGLALITVVGQCVGAEDYTAARKYILKLLGVVYLSMGATCAVIYLLLPTLVGFFDLSPQTTALAQELMRVFLLACIFFWPSSFTLPNGLRAAGDVRFTMLASVFSMWIFRVGLSYILGRGMGLGVSGVWLAMYADWVFRSAAFFFRFLQGGWKNRSLVA